MSTQPTPMKANEVRKAFTDFFVERAHSHQPSASLIPHDPTLLFTVAGMVDKIVYASSAMWHKQQLGKLS